MTTATVLARGNQLQNSRTHFPWKRGLTFAALSTFTSLAETRPALAFAFPFGLAFAKATFTAALSHRLSQIVLGVGFVEDS